MLVAKVRSPGWEPIKEPEKYFEIKMFPRARSRRSRCASFDEVKDQRLNKPLDAERPAMQDDLLTKEQTVARRQPGCPGMRAIAVKVNAESLAGGFVLPGSRVDVVLHNAQHRSSSKIVLQSMLVLAVDTQDQRNPEQKTSSARR